MYRVIAYHGKGNDNEVAGDLRLLWDDVRNFMKHRKICHAYCFQVVKDSGEADVILVVQYSDNVATKLALPSGARQSSQPHNQVDYWLYVRDKNKTNRRVRQ